MANLPQHILLPLLYARLYAGIAPGRDWKNAPSLERQTESSTSALSADSPLAGRPCPPPKPSLALMHRTTLELLDKTDDFIRERNKNEGSSPLPLSQILFQTKWKSGCQMVRGEDERLVTGRGLLTSQGGPGNLEREPQSLLASVVGRSGCLFLRVERSVVQVSWEWGIQITRNASAVIAEDTVRTWI